MTLLLKGMMPEGHHILLIREGDDPLTVDLGHREEMLQNVADSLAELRREVVEN